jgi:hypothetical protein
MSDVTPLAPSGLHFSGFNERIWRVGARIIRVSFSERCGNLRVFRQFVVPHGTCLGVDSNGSHLGDRYKYVIVHNSRINQVNIETGYSRGRVPQCVAG